MNPVELNRDHLTRVHVDAYFLNCHWQSLRTLAAYIPVDAHALLDLGCGPYADFARLVPDLDYTGIDIVPEYIEHLMATIGPSQLGHTRLFKVASMDERLPFVDASFDLICARHSLEHTAHLVKALAEIHRVLAPQGRLLFCVPTEPGDVEPAHLTRWDILRWRGALGTIVTIEASGRHPYFLNEFYGYGLKRQPGEML